MFAIIRTAKLKTRAEISSSGSHNFRERPTPNANPALTGKNQHTGAKSKDELLARFDDRLASQDKIRSNAVMGIEYLITASPEAFQNPDFKGGTDYFNDALRFLRDKHGKENVIAGSIHRDETTPHLVVYVVPIDEKGKLNCRNFLGGPSVMSKLQTDFAKSVGEKYGLKRGVENSSAEHVPVKEFYKKVNAPAPAISTRVPKVPEPTIVEKVLMIAGLPNDHEKLLKIADDARKERSKEIRAINESNAAKAQMYDLTKRNAEAVKRDLSDSKEKMKAMSSRLREMPLEAVLESFGAVQDPKDKANWKTEVGRITVNGQKFFNQDASKGGGGAIDLAMHINACDYKTALATLANQFGSDATAAAVASDAMNQVKEAVKSTNPAKSGLPDDVPSNWPAVKKWMEQARKIPWQILDAFREKGLIRSDERGNAIFVNQHGTGGEIRGKGANFKGYRGKRGLMVFERSKEKSVLVVESGTDAMAFAASHPTSFGLIVSTGGDFGEDTVDQLKALQKQGYRICVGTDNDSSGEAKFNKLRTELNLSYADRQKPIGRDWQDDLKASSPSPSAALPDERDRAPAPRI